MKKHTNVYKIDVSRRDPSMLLRSRTFLLVFHAKTSDFCMFFFYFSATQLRSLKSQKSKFLLRSAQRQKSQKYFRLRSAQSGKVKRLRSFGCAACAAYIRVLGVLGIVWRTYQLLRRPHATSTKYIDLLWIPVVRK